jgi:hypothetical protein
MARHLSHIEGIALSLVFEAMGERQLNRTCDEYMEIATRLPPLKKLHYLVNQQLQERLKSEEYSSRQICRFQAGDCSIWYEPYNAVNLSGMRQPRWRRGAIA